MPDKNEKARRKELLHATREEARRKVRDGLPVPVPVLKALFDYTDAHLKHPRVTTLSDTCAISFAVISCRKMKS